jgi:CheY-like chemotaxis protein
MGGVLGFESRVGVGATFWIEFAEIVSTTRGPAKATDLAPRPTAPVDGHFTALCIEDNPANIELVQAVFSTFWPNGRLLIAQSAEIGLELAASQNTDVILLDIQLPGMDGYTALKYLQTMEQTRQTPVIALTADAMGPDIQRGQAAGFASYLTKPIDLDPIPRTITGSSFTLSILKRARFANVDVDVSAPKSLSHNPMPSCLIAFNANPTLSL